MKINVIPTCIAVAIAALCSYGLFQMTNNENPIVLIIGNFISIALILSTIIGVAFNQSRLSVNIKVTSAVFLVLSVISNCVFCFATNSISAYIVINGILLLIWILLVYKMWEGGKDNKAIKEKMDL